VADHRDKLIFEPFYFPAIGDVLHKAVMPNKLLLLVVSFNHHHLLVKDRAVLRLALASTSTCRWLASVGRQLSFFLGRQGGRSQAIPPIISLAGN